MENLSAVNCASAGTGGCGQVRAKQLKRHISMFFSSPQALLENFLKGRGAKPWSIVFYSSRSPHARNSIAAVGFRFWESSKTRAKVLHPEDPPPTSFGSPKNTWRGVDISRGWVKYFSEISCLTTSISSRVKGGDISTFCRCGVYNIAMQIPTRNQNHLQTVQVGCDWFTMILSFCGYLDMSISPHVLQFLYKYAVCPKQ